MQKYASLIAESSSVCLRVVPLACRLPNKGEVGSPLPMFRIKERKERDWVSVAGVSLKKCLKYDYKYTTIISFNSFNLTKYLTAQWHKSHP